MENRQADPYTMPYNKAKYQQEEKEEEEEEEEGS